MPDPETTHIALPKLYGAPAYARPVMPVAHTERPFDPDDLPISATMSDDERTALERLPDAAWRPGGGVPVAALAGDQSPDPDAPEAALRPRAFSLRSLTARLARRS
jgi:hypothetical protein